MPTMTFEPRKRGEPRSNQVIFRATASERLLLEQIQERENLPSLSEVLRLAIAKYLEQHPLGPPAARGRRTSRAG